MKILIAGCGYLGTFLGTRLAADGHEVWGIRRTTVVGPLLEAAGIHPLQFDLLQPDAYPTLPPADAVVFCQAPSRPDDNYPKTYAIGTRNLMAALPKTCAQALFVSSTSVWDADDGSWIDESAPVASDTRASALLAAEHAVLESGRRAAVLRLSGLYGPGRNVIEQMKRGKGRKIGARKFTNRIHLEDAAGAAEFLLKHQAAGQVVIASDNEPVTGKDFLDWLALKAGDAAYDFLEESPSRGKRCSNQKIKKLGYKFIYPTYREGYSALLGESGPGPQ